MTTPEPIGYVGVHRCEESGRVVVTTSGRTPWEVIKERPLRGWSWHVCALVRVFPEDERADQR